MPKSVEININKVRYEELLDQTEKDLSRIKKQKSRYRDKMIVAIIEMLLAYGVYLLMLHFGEQEYAGTIFGPFVFLSRLLCIALVVRVIYFAWMSFVAKHPVEKKYMSSNKVIDKLEKDCVKYRDRIKQIKMQYEAALEAEADERGVTLNEKIKDFERSRSRAYSFYEDILSPEEEKARKDKENEPSDIERAIMKGFGNK